MKLAYCMAATATAIAAIASNMSTAAAADSSKYVALGDSFAAGVGISNIIDSACGRSDSNYAHLFADASGRTLTDATCGGATVDSVISEQVAAVTADTALITLGVGGNDIGFAEIARSCAGGSGSLPTGSADGGGGGCKSNFEAIVPARLSDTSAKLSTLLGSLRERAPEADIVLVSYPRLLPDDAAACATNPLKLSAEDIDWVRDSVVGGLNSMLRDAAAATEKTRYLSIYEISTGHDICAAPEDQWMNGGVVGDAEGRPLHPNRRSHAATAELMSNTSTMPAP